MQAWLERGMIVQQLHDQQYPTTMVVLSAMEPLTTPLVKRLHFNFSGDTNTNRVDKPEWMFDYILTILRYT